MKRLFSVIFILIFACSLCVFNSGCESKTKLFVYNVGDYIHPDVREKLSRSKEVVIVETLLENIKESYFADLKVVEQIPVDWNLIGLSTWEDAASGARA